MPRPQIKNEIRYRKGSTCDAANCERCVHFTSTEPGAVVPSQAKGLCKIIGMRDLARYRVRADYRCDLQEYDGFYGNMKNADDGRGCQMELTVSEQTRLSELERVIKDGLMTFIDVGASLLEIRNSRLYRHEFSTFEEYCRSKWQMSSSYSHKLIKAHEVISNIASVDNCPQTPITESQARPLAKLPPEQQKEAWQQAVETAPEGKVTARHVEKVVKEMKERTDYPDEIVERGQSKRRMVTEAMGIATFVIVHLERIRANDPKRGAAIDKVMQWCKSNTRGEE